MKKELGKIGSVSFGLGGYQGAMIGLHVTLDLNGGGCADSKCAWDANKIEWSKHCKWSESDRSNQYDQIMREVSDLLSDAKVDSVNQLKGKPIEATISDGTLKSWRILTEVL